MVQFPALLKVTTPPAIEQLVAESSVIATVKLEEAVPVGV
jgi:hypothetical protein